MFTALNPPLALPKPTAVGLEYAYWREVQGERRPAKAVGQWAEVWGRLDNEGNTVRRGAP